MAKKKSITPDRDTARHLLDELWTSVLNDENQETNSTIRGLVNSDQTAIRFCLPTQLLGKLTDSKLDTLCLQRGSGSDGRWDPRGFATKVIVPWNRANQSVLGKSSDPYVSNPLRRPRVDSGLDQMADRDQWENLCDVLKDVESANNESHTRSILFETLIAIRDRLRDLTFSYVIPERVSFDQAQTIVERFLSEKSGGDRGLAIVAAFFETLRERLQLFKDVRRGVINASDASTKSAGDLECIDQEGRLALAVEVKERKIGDADVHIAVAKAREFSVRELIFCCEGIVSADQVKVAESFSNVWASGTNLYQVTIKELLRGVLPLLGEQATKTFIGHVGKQLDAFSTQPRHRKTWKSLLDDL